jgi:peptidoglycan/xylan/chitin deacetylase (PgdA/CDA1 family)
MSRYRRHGLLVPLPFVLVLALAASGAAGAAEARTPSPPPPEGPWPPSRVLAADPAEPHAVAAAVVDTACPATTATVRHYAPGGGKTVALTFDDGPDPVQTPRILAMLAEHDVRATFCLVGVQVVRHPEIVRQIVEGGHTLCNHTWDHNLEIGNDEPEAIAADLARTNRAIHNVVPDAPVPFFRAPGGNFSDRLVQVAYREGMTSLHWEVDPRDWEHAPGSDDATHVKKIVQAVRSTVRPGAIVLSHDFNQPDTVDAYAELLPWLTANFSLGVPSVPKPPADR